MKLKNLLAFGAIFAAGAVSGLSATASEYHPIIEDGKVWVYQGVYMGDGEDGLVYHSFKFDGTVTVNGKEYKGFTMFKSEYYKGTKVYGELAYSKTIDRSGPTNFFREEEGKVYVLTKDNHIYSSPTTAEATFDALVTSEEYGEYLRYDFTLEDGQNVYMPFNSYINESGEYGDLDYEMDLVKVVIHQPVEIDGTERIKMSFVEVPDSELPEERQASIGFEGYVIEGIGATSGGDLAVFSPPYIPGIPNAINGPTYESALSCVYNAAGDVIYGSKFELPNLLIRENKVWNYAQAVDSQDVDFYRFQISYDTHEYIDDELYGIMKVDNIVGYKRTADSPDGVEVKKVNAESSFYLRERDGKVYIYNRAHGSKAFKQAEDMPNSFVLYDFTLGEGDGYDTYCSDNAPVRLEAESIETIESCGKEWRKFNFGEIECEGRVSPLCAVEGVGFLSGELGSTLVYFNDHAFVTSWQGFGAENLPIPLYANVGLINVTDREGNVLFDPGELGFNFNSVESVVADGMTLVSANGIVLASSESGSEVRVTVYGIDGTVRAEVSGTGEAAVNVSALGHGVYTVRATDGNAVRTLKVGV